MYSVRERRKKYFLQGMKDGLPIGLGYFTVSFSMGIAARNAGLTPLQTGLMSFFCNASAGQYAGISVIAENGTYIELLLIMLVANIRYILLSTSLSQRVANGTGFWHRLGMSCDITDELFGMEIARPGYLNPWYVYGGILSTGPFWWIGTAIGCVAGNLLPYQVANALGITLFSMFLAVIIPEGKKNKAVAGVIVVCFLCSYAASRLPVISAVPSGTRTIVLTVVIALGAALLFPQTEGGEEVDA